MRFSGSLSLRPVRIALLVNPNDFSSIKKFLQLNACLWGGSYNPIIPVFKVTPKRWAERHHRKRGLDIARGYLRFFEPDVVIEAQAGLAAAVGWVAESSALSPKRLCLLDEFISINSYGRPNLFTGTDISAVYAEMYRKEFQFHRPDGEPFAEITNSPENNAFFDLTVGVFPTDERIMHIREGFAGAFKPKGFSFGVQTFMEFTKVRYLTPLLLTQEGIKRDYDDCGELTFFVFDPKDGQDVIDFWNLRQFRRDSIAINADWIEDSAAFMRNIIEKNFRPLPGNPNGIMISTTVEFGRSISEERSKDIIERLFRNLPSGAMSYKIWYDQIWQAATESQIRRPLRVRLSAEASQVDVSIDKKYMRAVFPTLQPKFIDAPRDFGRSRWMNVLYPKASFNDDALATVYPSNYADPKFPRLRFGDAATVTSEGWTFSLDYKASESVNLQKGKDAFIDWFKTQGIVAHPSEPGRIAEQIIAAVGGLHSCAMFADRETVELLGKMAGGSNHQSQRVGNSVDISSSDRTVATGEWEQLFKRQKNTSWRMPWINLERFVEASVLRAGLQLKCPFCANKNWYDTKAMDYEVECARCMKSFRFPQTPDSLRELSWRYRVLGPFATPGYARGGYSVALTLRLFSHSLSSMDVNLTWSTGLCLSLPDGDAEIDFAFWYQRTALRRQAASPVLMIGEAKSFAKESVKSIDILRLKKVAETFPGSFIVVSILKDNLTKTEKNQLSKLARWGRMRLFEGRPRNPLIVLTGTELFAPYAVTAEWKRKGGLAKSLTEPAYVDEANPLTLAEITQQVYLDLPPFHKDIEDRWSRANSRRKKGTLEPS